MVHIRPATLSDLSAITAIYNEAIRNTTATFDTEEKSIEDRRHWFNQHDQSFPVIVAEEAGEIVGWASLSRWSDRCAYDSTAELSVYVDLRYRGKGIGKYLMQMIVLAGENAGLHCLLSRITEGNEQSIHLHEQLGFFHVGVLRQVGKKFGRFLDVYMMQKLIGKNVKVLSG